jgi:cytoskeleton protein RodZ
MSENWNVETVADSKTEAPPEKPPETAAPAIPSVLSGDHSLGKIMAIARAARGFSREQAAKASNIPGYYLTMIETDDYSSIADQLYLLPFLRRYATFVGLEQEEVASRFIREVQHADMNPVRASEPMAMLADRKGFPWGIVLIAGAAIALIAIAWFGYRNFAARKAPMANSEAPVAAEQAVPEAADTAPSNAEPAPMAVPPAAVPPPAASAPLGASAPNSAGRPAAPTSSSATSGAPSGAPSGSSAARPRVPVKAH